MKESCFGVLSLYILREGGGFPYLNKGFCSLPPLCVFLIVTSAVFITELAGVLCVVLVSFSVFLELAGVLCVVPHCLFVLP